MITGMVIMSIIISMVFFIFTSFSKQLSDYTNTRGSLVAMNLLKVDIEQTILRGDEVIANPQGFTVISGAEEIFFNQTGELLLKQSGLAIDTCFDHITDISVVVPSENSEVYQKERVTDITIGLLLGAKKVKTYFFKSYSNQEKINYSILNEAKY